MGNINQTYRPEIQTCIEKCKQELKTEKPQQPVLKKETKDRFNSPYPMLNYHNKIRTENGLPLLEWDHHLATKAEEWGQWLKANNRCVLRHPTQSLQEQNKYLPDNMGQNLYMGFVSPVSNEENWARNAAAGWFKECKFYDSKLVDERGVPKNFSGTEDQVGHFTQMMWKPTKKVGCAHIDFDESCNPSQFGQAGPGSGKIVVCNYDVGNIATKFEENVIYDKSKCENVDSWIE